jgi:cell division protein FtsI (penicillin-binding protein 3)
MAMPPSRSAPRDNSRQRPIDPKRRLYWVLGAMCLCAGGLLARALDIQVVRKEFYQAQGVQRFGRTVTVPAYRGAILDRNGEPLAISTPVISIWANPKELLEQREQLARLAQALELSPDALVQRVTQFSDREFVYLKRQMSPEAADTVMALDLPGVYSQREFRRFYPAGEVVAHVLGFTNIDDAGQEGAELAFNNWLEGKPGSKRIIQDRKGQRVADVGEILAAEPGQDLVLSIDRRIQYLAYRELKSAVLEHNASSGSLVMIDVPTGEILAMVNQPSYNPNAHDRGAGANLRNRAVTDVFEPGSVMKTFTVAAALESGKFQPNTPIDTSPGRLQIANYNIGDTNNYGLIDVSGVIMHSSNVGAAKIALQLSSDQMFDALKRFGFAQVSGSGFPGESPGYLPDASRWRETEKATLGYGYGLSVTPLQLAAAYAAVGNHGRMRAPSFVKNSNNPDAAVIDPTLAQELMAMLETVTSPQGTAQMAKVRNYRIAGKTGTARKASAQGYDKRYVGSFAGLAPASNPRIACVVVINDPLGRTFYGGAVAAPVFSKVVGGALRLLNVTPDAPLSGGLLDQITPEMLDATAEAVADPVLR